MTVLPICRFPEAKVLRLKAKRVPFFDAWIRKLIDNMIETMHQTNGVGLAAPQVGVSLRIIIVQIPGEELITLINPEIVKSIGEQEVTEGCLSVPGYYGEIKRYSEVVVKGLDREGKAIRIKATGLKAEALQHEIDHLNGKLYIDHVENPDKLYKIRPRIISNQPDINGNII